MREELIAKIREKEAKIAVVGLGHVGLPTAAIFASAGFQVVGADLNPEIVETVSQGKSHIKEAGLSELVEEGIKGGKLKVTTDVLRALRGANIFFICVETPLTRDKRPDLNYIEKACKDAAKGLTKGKLVIIESTVPPRTTKDFVAPMLEKESGLRCGEDFWLVHCPERILPGNALQELVENPRMVGGYNRESAEVVAELFRMVMKGEVLVTGSTSAEVAKLAENTFRDVNIAFANELALICEQVGVDVMEVVRLANTHPRVSIHKPGCGVGGPCLPKDPYLLLHCVKGKVFKSRLIEPSRELNDSMPKYTAELVIRALKKAGKDIKNSRVAVLGVAYKGEVDDARNSPTEKIVRELISLGSRVVVYDPYSAESFGAERAEDLIEAVKKADCIVITTDHRAFRELNLGKIKGLMNEKSAIVDGRRVVNPAEAEKLGFAYLGIGHSERGS